jgi:hypothetical protein
MPGQADTIMLHGERVEVGEQSGFNGAIWEALTLAALIEVPARDGISQMVSCARPDLSPAPLREWVLQRCVLRVAVQLFTSSPTVCRDVGIC